MKTIAISNCKGGTAKSTTAINLAAGLTFFERKVLLIDIDPQGHATKGLNVDTSQIPTISDIIYTEPSSKEDLKLENVVVNVPFDSIGTLDILPADLSLSVAEMKLTTTPAKEFKLRKILENSKYDYIIIDCPPTFGTLAINAFVASDYVVMPVQLGYFSLEGVSSFYEAFHHINQNVCNVINHQTEILGALITFFDTRTKIAKEIYSLVKDKLGDKVFKTHIPQNVKLCEAQLKGVPIYAYDPECSGSLSYWEFVNEFKGRLKEENAKRSKRSPEREKDDIRGLQTRFTPTR